MDTRYRAYRLRQAQGLISLLPREAIRPLYARARTWAAEKGHSLGKDPLATLLLFLQELLPLPPMDVWMADRAAYLEAHVKEEFDSAPAQRRTSPPVTVASRALEMSGRRWRASLELFRRDDAWRGYISFRETGQGSGPRTADIFREEDPEEIRDRFMAFHTGTLEAFLRSITT